MKKTNFLFTVAISSLIAVSANAANDVAIIKKAKELQNAKKYDEALKLYEANTKNTASENLYIDYAMLLINLKKYKECESMLTKAVAAYPNNLRIKNALGQAKYKNGDLSGATTLFSQVLIKDTNNKYAKEMLDKIRKDKVAASSPLANINNNTKSNKDGEDSEYETNDNEGFADGVTFKVSNKLSPEEQKELSKKLWVQLAETDKYDYNTIISLLKQVIEKCPQTVKAEDACWKLSNLYMIQLDPPEFENCAAVLEHLLSQYPKIEPGLMAAVKNRLVIAYQKTNNYGKLCALYEEQFKNNPNPDDFTFMSRALDYGRALKGATRYEEAQEWLTKVLERDNGKNSICARAARKELENLGN